MSCVHSNFRTTFAHNQKLEELPHRAASAYLHTFLSVSIKIYRTLRMAMTYKALEIRNTIYVRIRICTCLNEVMFKTCIKRLQKQQ